MIIFEPGGTKKLLLALLVVLFLSLIVWQWINSKPFDSVSQDSSLFSQIKEAGEDDFVQIKDRIETGLEESKNLTEELDKIEEQQRLIEETQKYLEEKKEMMAIDNPQDCRDKNGFWHEEDLICFFPTPPPGLPEDADSCEEQGGQWGLWLGSEEESCNMPTSDGGQECIDSGQCQGYCVTNLPEISLKDLPIETSGECTEYTGWQGCYSLVEEGFVYGITCD